ncbi:MAG: LacI family DNA-binding transcriptional regulator, partial [Dehalococcoidia bacterium]
VILYAIGRPPPALSRFRAANSPVVAMGPSAFCRGLPGVLVSERGATIAAMRRLIDLGHRRIAFINYDTPPGRYAYRTRAIRRELTAEDGPGWNPELLVNVNTVEECRARLAALLGQPNRPTALVVLTTPFIPYVLQSIYEAGLRVPEDISVLVYGDSPWAAAHRPPLSVVAVDYYEWGRETAELLLRQIEAPNETPPRFTRESQFIERASLAAPPIGPLSPGGRGLG